MFAFLDIKMQIPSTDYPRMMLPDPSRIGFFDRLYSIIIKTTPLGNSYLFHPDNLFFKLFIFLHPLHNLFSMNEITATEIFGNVLFRSYDIVNIFTKLQLSYICSLYSKNVTEDKMNLPSCKGYASWDRKLPSVENISSSSSSNYERWCPFHPKVI